MLFKRFILLVAITVGSAATWAEELGAAPLAPTAEELKALRLEKPPVAVAEFGSGFSVNIQKREEVRNFYNTVYPASLNPVMMWTGNVGTCAPGTTDSFFKEQVRLRVNFFRALAGVPSALAFDATYSAKDQEAAIMMSANNTLSHFPPANWKCYTANGAEAAGKSNLAFGYSGPAAVDAYMEDNGFGNAALGHRRWVIYPQTKLTGTGDVPPEGGNEVNALWAYDANYGTTRPATREPFVAWPPPGYVPYQLIPARWSLSFPGAGFSGATVTMSSNGVSVAVTKETVVEGYGESAVAWYPTGMATGFHQTWPQPTADTTFAINVSGVTGAGVPSTFSYTVKVFDPATTGPDTVLPTITGPDSIPALSASSYTFTKLPLATAYDVRARERLAMAIEGAENGLGSFLVKTSGTYDVVVPSPVASGTKAFRLTHAGNFLQTLTFARPLFVRSGGALNFASRMGIAAVSEFGKVGISTDGGVTFVDVFTRTGNGASVLDANYVNVSIPLDAYVGKVITVKFSFDSFGSFFNTSAPDFGWNFDSISFSNVDQLRNPTVFTGSMAGGFSFTPPTASDYLLEVRPQLYGEFLLDWGPGKTVTAFVDVGPRIEFLSNVTLGASTVKLDFNARNLPVGAAVQLFKTATLNGTWTLESAATFETVLGTTGRVTIPRNANPATIYRLQAL
jgi:hypothetical protein